jgi:hypothetical protein
VVGPKDVTEKVTGSMPLERRESPERDRTTKKRDETTMESRSSCNGYTESCACPNGTAMHRRSTDVQRSTAQRWIEVLGEHLPRWVAPSEAGRQCVGHTAKREDDALRTSAVKTVYRTDIVLRGPSSTDVKEVKSSRSVGSSPTRRTRGLITARGKRHSMVGQPKDSRLGAGTTVPRP